MRLSGSSLIGQQNHLINAARVNQSVTQRSHGSKSAHMAQMRRDSVAISPQGKVASIIEHLNKQKANILERRDQFLENAKKQGHSADTIQAQLEQFDEQIKDIDKQIQEVTLKKMQEAAEKSTPKSKGTKPKTKQDAQNAILANITAASTTLDRVETVSSEKEKLDGSVRVLKSEIELDKSRDTTGSGQESIAAREKLVGEMQGRSQGLLQDISDGLNEANEIMEENNELATTKPVEDDKDNKVEDKDKADNTEKAEDKKNSNIDDATDDQSSDEKAPSAEP